MYVGQTCRKRGKSLRVLLMALGTYIIIVQRVERTADNVHLTFKFNTDGVAVFSSSKKGNLWPVYLAVNELPIKLRFSRKYLIPSFLHCQPEEPSMITYLSLLMDKMKDFVYSGNRVVSSHGAKLRVTGELLTVSLDLPARAKVGHGAKLTVTGELLTASLDLPARAKVGHGACQA